MSVRRMAWVAAGVACALTWLAAGAAMPSTVDPCGESPWIGWLDALSSTDGGERKAAREALAASGPQVVPDLIERMRSDSALVRWEAVNLLGILRDLRATPAVLDRAMTDTDVHVRWRAIWALSRLDDGTVVGQLVAALHVGDSATAWNCAVALSMFGESDGVALLHAGLHAGGWIQWEAINALGRVWDDATADLLIPVLRAGSLDARKEAALSLGRIGSAAAVGALATALADDPEPGVRWRAAMMLAICGGEPALAALRSAKAQEEDSFVLEEIERALSKLGGGMH